MPRPAAILDWYDHMARDLVWRVAPQDRQRGILPDPYRVWLSEVMLQQTTVAAVKGYFETFTTTWPDIGALAAAEDSDVMAAWAGLGYYARARNLLKCARIVVSEMDGCFPDTEAELLKLPGIGPYTAAAIAAIAFDRPSVVMDGNIERVVARLFAVLEPLPGSKPLLKDHAASLTPRYRAGDYAQAVMDLGATICTPRNPACGLCPWRGQCSAHDLGIAEDLPRKKAKTPKPIRHGIAYFVTRADGQIWLITRPPKGLLGGMLALPSSDWSEQAPASSPPFAADWRPLGEVRHTFTHFHLRLQVIAGDPPGGWSPGDGAFYDPDIAEKALPTVMRKALRIGLSVTV